MLTYEKLMQEEGLSFDGLSNDAKTAINKIKKTQRGVNLTEKSGKKVGQHVWDEIKMLDKMATNEINEMLDAAGGKKRQSLPNQNNDDAAKKLKEQEELKAKAEKEANERATADAESKRLKEEADRQKNIDESVDENGVVIEKELKGLVDSGKTEISLADLRSLVSATYNVIFENYEAGSDNGIECSLYKIVEIAPEKFKVSKI